MENPRIKFLFKLGKFKVYLVNEEIVQDLFDLNYNNFGQHYRFPFIPKDEFWISQEGYKKELPFYLTHLLIENWLMGEKGLSYNKATDLADKEEKAVRHKSKRYKEAPKTHKEQIKKIEIKKLLTFRGIDIYEIDDELVRDLLDVSFTEGGHDLVYDFIPSNTIWISNTMTWAEKVYTILHEYTERFLMERGMSYSKSHIIALKFEYDERHKDDRL